MVTTKKKPVKKSGIKTRPKVTPKINVHEMILIDASGSMSGHEQNVVQLLNNQLTSIKTNYETNKSKLGNVTVQIGDFGAKHGEVNLGEICQISDLDDEIDPDSYRPSSDTPLYRAIWDALNSQNPGKNDAVTITIITDGNNTEYFDVNTLKNLISRKIGTDKFSIICCMPPNSRTKMEMLGIPPGNITEWERSTKGISTLSHNLNAGRAANFTANYSKGITQTRSYFSPDLDVSKTAVKRSLNNVTSKLTKIRVNIGDNLELSSFCINKVGRFTIGHAFYELTKNETVQDYKAMVLEDINTGELFSGTPQEVRDFLGLPTSGDIKLTPNFNPKWRLYVRSTSWNRKLVPSSSILYLNSGCSI